MTQSILERGQPIAILASPPRSTNQAFEHFMQAHGWYVEAASANPDRGNFLNEFKGHESNLDAIAHITLRHLPIDPSYTNEPLALNDTPHHLLLKQYLSIRSDLRAVLITRQPEEWADSVRRHLHAADNLYDGYPNGFPADAVLLESLLPGTPYRRWADIPIAVLAEAYRKRLGEVTSLFEQMGKTDQLLIIDKEEPNRVKAEKIGNHLGFKPTIDYAQVDAIADGHHDFSGCQ